MMTNLVDQLRCRLPADLLGLRAADRIEELERENIELRKDAERLDFYEINTPLVIEVVGTWYHRKGYGQMARKAKSLRAAIDEAMK